jgi:hypothetical protein
LGVDGHLAIQDVQINVATTNVKFYRSGGVQLLNNGLEVGSPTGGLKGVGTINIAGDIYKNNTAYTNPDFVFEHFYRGQVVTFADNERAGGYGGLMPLAKLRDYTRSYLRLPGISDDPMGLFMRGDVALEKLEEAHLYIVELHERVTALESREAVS